METKWSDFGFLGSLLLIFYGILSLLIFFTPPAFYGAGASIIAIAMALLAISGAILFCLGFLAMRIELNVPGPWLTYLVIFLTFGVWIMFGVSQILVALGQTIGLIYWYYSVFAVMLTYLFWGLIFFSVRTTLGGKSRFGFGASLLFLINGLGWLSFIGYGILALGAFLCLFIYAPSPKFSIFSPLTRFFSTKRVTLLRNWGPILLIIYSLLGMKWVINGYYLFPAAVAAVINVLSLLIGTFAIVGITMVLRADERRYEIPTFFYAQLLWVPSMLIVWIADLQWLMSNSTVFIDPAWSGVLYNTLNSYIWWASVVLAAFSFVAAIAYLQTYRLPELRGETVLLFLHLSLLASTFFWVIIALTVLNLLPILVWLQFYLGLNLLNIFSLGFLGFFFVGIFLWRRWKKFTKKDSEKTE